MRGDDAEDTVQDLSRTGLGGTHVGGWGHAASSTDERVGGVARSTLDGDEGMTGTDASWTSLRGCGQNGWDGICFSLPPFLDECTTGGGGVGGAAIPRVWAVGEVR